MFEGSLDAEPVVTKWNVNKVETMQSAFKDALVVKPCTARWRITRSRLTSVEGMFQNAYLCC